MGAQKMKTFRSYVKYLILFTILFSAAPVSSNELCLQKAFTYQGDEDITGWYMSEKLDGIRGYWNGKQLLTRKGNIINAPEWFINKLPPFELDGELWSRRKDFEFIQSTVLKKIPTGSWEKISFNIFEVPNQNGNFEKRLEKARIWFQENKTKHVRIIPQIVCNGKKHLDEFLQAVESKGGEGVIVKDPNQSYHTGRPPYILKYKSFKDMEGVVIAINEGKGKYKDMMGSLRIKLENGIIFNLGSGFSDIERANPPKINSIITFKYYGFTKNGIPKFPSFLHVRENR